MRIRITNPTLAQAWAFAWTHWPALAIFGLFLMIADAVTH